MPFLGIKKRGTVSKQIKNSLFARVLDWDKVLITRRRQTAKIHMLVAILDESFRHWSYKSKWNFLLKVDWRMDTRTLTCTQLGGRFWIVKARGQKVTTSIMCYMWVSELHITIIRPVLTWPRTFLHTFWVHCILWNQVLGLFLTRWHNNGTMGVLTLP